jgi:hypothetical protein
MLQEEAIDSSEVIAVGTNSTATTHMISVGNIQGATGENSVIYLSKQADLIIGPIAILAANSMLGEITPKMAEAIASSTAKKILIPINRCNLSIVGIKNINLNDMIKELINDLKTTKV